MPRSKSLAHYGPEYEHLLVNAHKQGGFTVPLPSPGHARTFRGRLYAYFSTLRRDGTRPDLIAIADAFSIAVEGSGVRLFPCEDSWDNIALREALGIAKSTPVPQTTEPTAQQKLIAKLEEIRNRNKEKK